MGCIFSADIGTTSLKAGIITAAGDLLAYSAQSIEPEDTSFIANEWLAALKNAADEMYNYLTDVEAVCISGNGPTLAAESGRTLLWNTPLPKKYSAIQTHSLFIPRIKAFMELYADDWNKTEVLFSGQEFLIFKLTGERVTVLPEERFIEAYWTDAALELHCIPKEKLARFVPLGHIAGIVLPQIAEFLHLSPQTKIICGGPDFTAAMIGTNTLSPGKICDCAGSSEGINLCTDKPFFEKDLLTLPSVVKGLWNIASLNTASGSMFAEYKRQTEKAEARSIQYSELIKRSLEDINSEGGRILLQIKKNVRSSIDVLCAAAQKNGIPMNDEMTISGGQAKNAQWMQAKADGAGIGISVCNIADAELLGNAVTAQTALGRYNSIADAANALVKITKTYMPDKSNDRMKIYKIPATIKTLIFDIDSTLYTNEEYAFEQVDVQLRHFANLKGISEAAARDMISSFRRKWSTEHEGKKISLGNALTHFGIPIEESVKMRRELILPEKFLKKDKALYDTLNILKTKYALVCVTNNPVLPAQKTLSALGIDSLISSIIGLDTCNKSKPTPAPFLLAAKMTSAKTEECLSIGDRYDMDIALPLELGMGGILVGGVKDVYRLPDILCK